MDTVHSERNEYFRSSRKPAKRRWLTRALAVVSAAVIVVATGAAPAYAEDVPVIRKVDSSQFPKVSLTVLKPPAASAADAVQLSENGRPVTNSTSRTMTEANVPIGIVLAIDTSEAMKQGDAVTKAKAAAVAMVEAKQPNQKFAVVAFNGIARPVVNFTDDAKLLTDGINGLQASNDSAMWSGLSMAAGLFADDAASDLQPNVVLVSGAPDTVSGKGAFDGARSGLRGEHAAVFVVGVQQQTPIDGTSLAQLALDTGGRYIETQTPDSLTQILSGFGNALSNQAIVEYTSLGGKSLEIEVGVGVLTTKAYVSPGTVAEGSQVSPTVVDGSKSPPFFRGTVGLVVIGILSLAGVGLILYGVIEIVGTERNQLSRALRPYSDEPEEGRDFSKIADSEIIKKAVASTARLADERGLLQVVERKLEQADLPLRPAEALFFTAVAAVVAMVVGLAVGKLIGMAVAGLVFAYLPIFTVNTLARRRRRKFTAQLPDTLQLLGGSLRAGYSLVQGLDAVSKQADAPMGQELQRAMGEARLGRPVDEALQEISDRMGSDDFEWTVMAIKIQREVGGNLAELLDTVAETMVARERLRREVRALTAEGRLSAYVLCALPFGVGTVISVLNPSYMTPMWHNFLGQVAVAVAMVMVIVGYVVMTKLIEIEA